MAQGLTANEIFNQTLYKWVPKILNENVDIFNRASNGAILMQKQEIAGSWQQTWTRTLEDIVLYRDPTSSAAIPKAHFEELMHNMIKVGFGTKEVEWTYAKFEWINQNPEQAGFIIAQTLARETLQNSVKMAVGVAGTVLEADTAVVTDKSTAGTMKYEYFLDATRPFGDQHNRISAWIVHSKQAFDFWKENLKNENRMFSLDNIVIYRNPLGVPVIVTDVLKPNVDKYSALGLVRGAVEVGNMEQFRQNTVNANGKANITASFQGEWSQTLSVKNHKFDTSQTPAITYAKLTQSSNWTKVSNNVKEQAGVVLITK